MRPLEDAARRAALKETGLIISNLQLLGVFSGSPYYYQIENGDGLYTVTAVYLTRNFILVNCNGMMLKQKS